MTAGRASSRRAYGGMIAILFSLVLFACAGGPAAQTPPPFVRSDVGLAGVGQSSLAWGDYDNDGYPDLVLCGFTGARPTTVLYRNNGDGTFSENAGAGFPGVYYGRVAWGDCDNDGDLDLALCGRGEGGYIAQVWRNNGDGTFSDTGSFLQGVHYSALAWGDCDGDGDLDLVVSGFTGWSFETTLYLNDGAGSFGPSIAADLPGVYLGSLAWGDCDNDGDLDLAVCGFTGSAFLSAVYVNDGGGSFTASPAAPLQGVYGGSLAWADYDNDGGLDLALAGYTGTQIVCRLYRNDGTGVLAENTAANLGGVHYGALAWGDYDNDGDLDLAAAGYTGVVHAASVWVNNGDGSFSEDRTAFLPGVTVGCLAWADYDRDGDLDIALCGYTGTAYEAFLYRSLRAEPFVWDTPNTPPAPPDGLSYSAGSAVLRWSPASDAETPADGLYYAVRVGTAPGAGDIVSGAYGSPLLGGYVRPRLDDGPGFLLRTLAPGVYYWSVRTIDAGLEVSDWSAESSFIHGSYAVSGTVVLQGGVASPADAVVSLVGAQSYTVNPAPDGTYSFPSVPDGGYTLGVALAGYAFSPEQRTVSVLTDLPGQDFSGTILNPVGISGYVTTPAGTGIPGVDILFSNAGGSTVTGAAGYYWQPVPTGWSGTATPVVAGASFTPAARTYSNLTIPRSSQNYTGGIAVSGCIRSPLGPGVPGVSVVFSDGGGQVSTDAAGCFTALLPPGWSGTATPSLAGCTFDPPSRAYAGVFGPLPDEGYSVYASVSGWCRSSGGTGLAGAVVSFSAGGGSATTDGTGRYENTAVPYGWSGTATPALVNYAFSPSVRTYAAVTASLSEQNYTGTTNWLVSGTVTSGFTGLAGATVRYAGTTSGSVATDAGGYYEILLPEGWTGTMTPAMPGYLFGPASRSYAALAAHQESQDYAAFGLVSISGTVRTPGGAALGGVTLRYSGTYNGGMLYEGVANANSGGVYSISLPSGWEGSVTPVRTNYLFTPGFRTYGPLAVSQTLQDYVGAPAVIISGYVKNPSRFGVQGVTIACTGGYAGITQASGYYTVMVPSGWSGTAVPSLAGYAFVPASRSYTNLTINKSGQSYTAAGF